LHIEDSCTSMEDAYEVEVSSTMTTANLSKVIKINTKIKELLEVEKGDEAYLDSMDVGGSSDEGVATDEDVATPRNERIGLAKAKMIAVRKLIECQEALISKIYAIPPKISPQSPATHLDKVAAKEAANKYREDAEQDVRDATDEVKNAEKSYQGIGKKLVKNIDDEKKKVVKDATAVKKQEDKDKLNLALQVAAQAREKERIETKRKKEDENTENKRKKDEDKATKEDARLETKRKKEDENAENKRKKDEDKATKDEDKAAREKERAETKRQNDADKATKAEDKAAREKERAENKQQNDADKATKAEDKAAREKERAENRQQNDADKAAKKVEADKNKQSKENSIIAKRNAAEDKLYSERDAQYELSITKRFKAPHTKDSRAVLKAAKERQEEPITLAIRCLNADEDFIGGNMSAYDHMVAATAPIRDHRLLKVRREREGHIKHETFEEFVGSSDVDMENFDMDIARKQYKTIESVLWMVGTSDTSSLYKFSLLLNDTILVDPEAVAARSPKLYEKVGAYFKVLAFLLRMLVVDAYSRSDKNMYDFIVLKIENLRYSVAEIISNVDKEIYLDYEVWEDDGIDKDTTARELRPNSMELDGEDQEDDPDGEDDEPVVRPNSMELDGEDQEDDPDGEDDEPVVPPRRRLQQIESSDEESEDGETPHPPIHPYSYGMEEDRVPKRPHDGSRSVSPSPSIPPNRRPSVEHDRPHATTPSRSGSRERPRSRSKSKKPRVANAYAFHPPKGCTSSYTMDAGICCW
jgi:colicin import membrane protein